MAGGICNRSRMTAHEYARPTDSSRRAEADHSRARSALRVDPRSLAGGARAFNTNHAAQAAGQGRKRSMRHTRILFTHYGGPEELRVVEEECPEPKEA